MGPVRKHDPLECLALRHTTLHDVMNLLIPYIAAASEDSVVLIFLFLAQDAHRIQFW
jgi:hypothetical protein